MKSRIFSFLLMLWLAANVSVQAYSTSYYATTSRLNSGHWVKIATDSEGVYQLTYDKLRELGFSDPSKVQVYGYGALQFTDNTFVSGAPDDLNPVATLHTDDGRILFFGQGDVMMSTSSTLGSDANQYTLKRNYYDTRSYYFLSDVEGSTEVPSKSIETAQTARPALESHIHLDLIEEDLQNPIKGGIGYHAMPVNSGDGVDFRFKVRNYRPTPVYDCGSFVYMFAMSSTEATQFSVEHDSNVEIPDDPDAEYNAQAWSIAKGEYTYYNDVRGSLQFMPSATNDLSDTELTFTVRVPSINTISYCAPDRAFLRYPRANILDERDPCLIMNFGRDENRRGQRVDFPDVDADNDIMVWAIDKPSAIAAYPTEYDPETHTLSFVLSDNTTSRVMAFRTGLEYPSPAVIGEIANQNLHGTDTPHMLIITTAELETVAERLADAHRRVQGLDVNVVVHDRIFNEYSSGSRDAMGYRRLAKMYYDREPAKFRYILFLGPSSYDNRCMEITKGDRLITYQNTHSTQTRNVITNYSSDVYFGNLVNNYMHENLNVLPFQVAVGRVPALNVSQATAYVNKAVKYLESTANYNAGTRVILVGGDSDRNTHLNHSIEVLDSMRLYAPQLTYVNIPIQGYTAPDGSVTPHTDRNVLLSELIDGAGYFNYCGHGDPNFICNHIYDKSIATETKTDSYPFIMFSSCDQFAFDHQQNGLIETMLFTENGGILGGVGACRSVYISYNQLSCVSTAMAYAQSRAGDTYGDLYLRARDIIVDKYNHTSNYRNAMTNNMNYNLAGDPALPLMLCESSVKLLSVDNVTEPSEPVDVKPLRPVKLTGNIVDSDDNVLDNFNGEITINIFATPDTVTTYNTLNEQGYKPIDVVQDFKILARTTATVVNGAFETTVTLPAPVTPGKSRMSMVAVSDDGKHSAMSSFNVLNLLDYSAADYEDETFDAPVIKEYYAEDPAFTPGDELPSTITVTAIIEPSTTGLAIGGSTSSIGTRTSLTLDDTHNISQLDRCLSRNEDGTYTLTATVEDLEEGLHSLTLTVANNAGLIDRSTIDFVVLTRLNSYEVTVAENTARTAATIDSDVPAGTDNRLVITDMHGKTVFSQSNVNFPFKWNLCDTESNAVADGHYRVSVLVRDGSHYSHTDATEIVVIK